VIDYRIIVNIIYNQNSSNKNTLKQTYRHKMLPLEFLMRSFKHKKPGLRCKSAEIPLQIIAPQIHQFTSRAGRLSSVRHGLEEHLLDRRYRKKVKAVRSTVIEIAREAGVSSATVDRVLNNRAGVRNRTREIVLETARRLGYLADTSEAAEAGSGAAVRLDFILPFGTNTFVKNLQRELESQGAARPGLEVSVATIEGFNPDSLARALQELDGKTKGVGVIALDHPTVREAIRGLSASGVKVVTLASDILHVPRIAYIGIDNRAAGRLAGYLLARFLGTTERKKVALFAGSLSYRGHEEREMGFRHILAEEFANLEIVELREMNDDRERAFAEATNLLERHADLAGIYNIGAGNQGIARALKNKGRAGKVVFVGHELTEHNKAFLLDGTFDAVIDQNPRVEAREALNILIHSIRGLPYEQHQPRLQVIFRENIPEV
jgi:LacI family transcriptional regulator